jgi:broad specificity phosphatase PhoE
LKFGSFVQQIHTLVLIRHGESQWNIENRFTGWVDVPLAPSGVAESHRASAEIKKENLEFDICYTSTLKRAIKTCWNILEDLDVMHTPVVQDWRLNERMYGALQGETPMRLLQYMPNLLWCQRWIRWIANQQIHQKIGKRHPLSAFYRLLGQQM